MSNAAIAPATRALVIARSKRRGAWAMSLMSVPRTSALDEEDSRGSTVTAFELDRTARELVVSGPHLAQVETLDDHDLRAEERLVRGITFLLRSLRLGHEKSLGATPEVLTLVRPRRSFYGKRFN